MFTPTSITSCVIPNMSNPSVSTSHGHHGQRGQRHGHSRRSGVSNATPVRLCRVCWTTHHPDTTGSTSRELEEWYCSEGCRYIRRLRCGLLQAKDGQGIYNEVLNMWQRHCPPDVIKHRRDKVLARIANDEERVIREVVNDDE